MDECTTYAPLPKTNYIWTLLWPKSRANCIGLGEQLNVPIMSAGRQTNSNLEWVSVVEI